MGRMGGLLGSIDTTVSVGAVWPLEDQNCRLIYTCHKGCNNDPFGWRRSGWGVLQATTFYDSISDGARRGAGCVGGALDWLGDDTGDHGLHARPRHHRVLEAEERDQRRVHERRDAGVAGRARADRRRDDEVRRPADQVMAGSLGARSDPLRSDGAQTTNPYGMASRPLPYRFLTMQGFRNAQ